MRASDRPARARDGLDAFASALLAAVLLFAPLIKGGNRPLPLLALELAALALLALALMRPASPQRLPRPLLLGIALLMALPLLQLLPLPFSWWAALPGRAAYAEALAAFAAPAATRPLSLVPQATEAAWLALLPPLAVFLTVVRLDETTLRRVVYLFIGIAAAQAILALVQFGGGASTTFRTGVGDIGTAVGTYVNRNHLAGMLAMALPLAMGVLASRLGRSRESLNYRSSGLLGRLAAGVAQPSRLNQGMLLGAVCIALLLGIVFSRSRSGISLTMLGILLSAGVYGLRLGKGRSTRLTVLFAVAGLALALEVGLAPVLERFSVDGALEDARWTIFGSSVDALVHFFPFGSGLGTFPDVYRAFQPGTIGQFVNHAHNDYIEYVFEGGLVAVAVIALFAAAYVRAWPRLVRHARWGTLGFMQAGAGLAVLLMALHGLTEYNWHIPANAVYFALMAGVFFHRGERPADAGPAAPEAPKEPVARPARVAPANARNPFAE